MIPASQNQSLGEAPSDNHYQYESAAECEICSQLQDCEDGCDKEYKESSLLPPAAYRLVGIPGPHALMKCPLCGTYYWYIHFYEYSPTGNDEEEHLRRLPVAEALADLCAEEIYSELEDFARRGAAYAKMVLVEINRSKLKRDTVQFKSLQSRCKAMRQRASG
jgi:hypothetical protein